MSQSIIIELLKFLGTTVALTAIAAISMVLVLTLAIKLCCLLWDYIFDIRYTNFSSRIHANTDCDYQGDSTIQRSDVTYPLNVNVQKKVTEQNPGECNFVRFWARELRLALGNPTNPSALNKRVALDKLQAMFRNDSKLKNLRRVDFQRYANRIVAYSFIPGEEEIECAQLVASQAAQKRMLDVERPVIGRTAGFWPFFASEAIRAKNTKDF